MKKSIFFALLSTLVLSSCKKDENEPTESASVYILSAVATPTSSESVTVKNNTGAAVDLSGWTIGDSNNQNAYSIPNGTNLAHGSTSVFNASTMGFQINDSGETIYLTNSSGSVVDTWSN